jgi:hypothetical protein
MSELTPRVLGGTFPTQTRPGQHGKNSGSVAMTTDPHPPPALEHAEAESVPSTNEMITDGMRNFMGSDAECFCRCSAAVG